MNDWLERMEWCWPSIALILDRLAPVDNLWLKFVIIWCEFYLLHIVLYLLSGLILSYINNRNPDRKIQKKKTRVPVKMEIKQSFVSLLATSLCFVMACWLDYVGWRIFHVDMVSNFDLLSISSVFISLALFLLLAALGDLWFYAEHRLAHTKFFVRFHRVHHQSPIPTPWTNDRFAFAEVIMIQSYMIVAMLLLPIPGTMIFVYRLYDQIKGMIGHCGYEYFAGRMAYWPFPLACVAHHDAHHEKYSVNFGAFLTVWDRLFGTLEEGYDQKVRTQLSARR